VDVRTIISSGLLETYLLGMASPEETQLVEKLAAEHADVRQELDAIRATLSAYASAFAQQPAANLKQKIEQDFLNSNGSATAAPAPLQQAIVYKMSTAAKWGIAASVALLLGSLLFNYSLYKRANQYENELAATKTQLNEQRQTADAMQTSMEMMTAKNSRAVALNATANYPGSAARVYWVKNTGDVYVDPSMLPAAPAGNQYQLWAIVDGQPVDAGVIEKDGKRLTIQKMKSFGKVQAFAITLEVEKGSKNPTLDKMYVMGTL
jgi:anti-sigma-K factor RskA